MKQKLSSTILPSSPSWPQLDHRTAEAIASGVVLGMENIIDFNFNHTIGKLDYDSEAFIVIVVLQKFYKSLHLSSQS